MVCASEGTSRLRNARASEGLIADSIDDLQKVLVRTWPSFRYCVGFFLVGDPTRFGNVVITASERLA